MKNFIKQKLLIVAVCCKYLYCFITKKQIWIFTAWEAKIYSDNPKYLFEHILANHRDKVTCFWVTNNRRLAKELKKRGLPAVVLNTDLRKQIAMAICDKFFFSDLYYPLDPLEVIITKKYKLLYINLWHGMPIKSIGDLSDIKQNYLIATNQSSQKILANTMKMDLSKVILTGQPKNDGLFTEKSLRKKLGIDTESYIILYMPTYRGSFNCSSMNRDNKSGIFLEQGIELSEFNQILEKENAYFIIKPHLRNKINFNFGSRFIILDDFNELVPEIDNYEIMGNSSMLISDYSSILLDYFITNKPILFYTPDFIEYSNFQKLNYEYSDIASGEQIFSQQELFKRIKFYLENRKFLPVDYNKIRNKFNVYQDANSSERTFNVFLKMK